MTKQHTHNERCWCREKSCNDANPWCSVMDDSDSYPGSVDQRLDQMRKDLKALAHSALQNDDLAAVQLFLAAVETIEAAHEELRRWSYDEAQWTSIMEMQPPPRKDDPTVYSQDAKE